MGSGRNKFHDIQHRNCMLQAENDRLKQEMRDLIGHATALRTKMIRQVLAHRLAVYYGVLGASHKKDPVVAIMREIKLEHMMDTPYGILEKEAAALLKEYYATL